jgi:regulator of protease activity HflC (stomatin/prohibitin superfamily)
VQLAVRSVVGATPLEDLSRQRFDIGKQVFARVEPEADRIGIIVHALEIREVVLHGELNEK